MGMGNVISAKGRHVVTVAPGASVTEAARKLREYKIGLLVVCDDMGAVVGVLSERDLVRAIAERDGNVTGLKVEALMTRDPLTCNLGDSPAEVLRTMNSNGFRHMPVLDKGRLKGLVSSRDVLWHLLERADLGHATMRKLNELGIY